MIQVVHPNCSTTRDRGRMLIEPNGDTFHPSEQPTHKIRDIIRSTYDAPYFLEESSERSTGHSGERSLWIGKSVWAEFTSAWVSPDYTRRDQNKQNRASDVGGLGSSHHTGGFIPHTEHRRRLKEMMGRESTSIELHSHTHKRQEDKQWVDERVRKAYEEYTRLRESQAAAGEGPSGGSVEILTTIAALTAELEQVMQSQADWQMQMQQQQVEM
ncbi:hypothetical protein M5K25_000545 [Dendrobium thyrsiflorum]|uniref:Uncharacterized protein n=1 Tax=Dendrobium thyrsiflorum TaxID=117978 RepID=A0ABD0VW31_DENTH